MKKQIILSALTMGLLSSVSVQAADDLGSMFSEGKTSGEIRAFYINRDDNTKTDTQIATAIGGHLKYETGSLNGLSLGTAFYTTNRILKGLESTLVNNTLLKNDNSSYSILGEAYVQYSAKGQGSDTTFKIGRQKLNTPLLGADDARMIPNLFEAYAMTNKDIANTTLTLAHVTKINPGSFANAYAGAAGPTAGYTSEGPAHTTEHQGTFTNMGTWATGDATKGVSTLGLVYKGDNFKLQAWDYYAHDILNAIYLQADMSMKVSDSFKSFAAVQYINQSDIGSSFVGKVDSDFVGAKVGAKTGGLTAYVAYSQQSKADTYVRGLESSTVTMWGGVPAFTQGMVTRHMFMAGTKASKVAATYNFKEQGLNLSATAYYASFDMDANSGYGAANTVKEPGFDIKYKPASVKNLQLRLRGNFVNDFKTDRDWDEYRLIVTYKF